MAASIFDSALYAGLFPTGEAGRLFSDSAAIRAMLLVEGALAKVQGEAGIIPQISAAAIHRASLEIQIDPGALAQSTGQNGVTVPGLVAAFRDEMQAPEHAAFVHWGATSQDIMDTGLMLRLRQALALAEQDIISLLKLLGASAGTFADTPIAGRTYGQAAAPTTWGAVLAGFGAPLLDALDTLPALRERALWVSLSGAVGTGSMLGPEPASLRAKLAEALNLNDPGRSWQNDRGPALRVTDWLGGVSIALGAMGETLTALASSEVGETSIVGAGTSSTMPQKQNPVGPESLVALAQQSGALRSGMIGASMHQHQRDGAAWFTEWMLVPQIALSTAAGLQIANKLAGQITPDTGKMTAHLQANHGLIFAEALSFALSQQMPRQQAQSETKKLCAAARTQNRPLHVVASEAYPDLPSTTFETAAQLGTAPQDARAFSARAKAL